MTTYALTDTGVLTGRSLRHILRSPDTIITTAVTPVALMLLFVYVFGGAIDTGSTESYVDYLLPGILLITIASGVAYTSYRLFLDLQGGIFERFQSMPIARSSVLWAHVLTSLVANLTNQVLTGPGSGQPDCEDGWVTSRRLVVPASALLWGLQMAFLSPALALILTTLYGATTAEVGWVLAIYNTSGFVASLVVPAWADRRHTYLRVMLICGGLTMLLALLLALATTLPMATAALVVIGGPAGVGMSMLYAHLRHSGAKTSDIVNTRAIVSVAWVAGPPLATLIIGVFGERAILFALAVIAVFNIATTAVMITHRNAAIRAAEATGDKPAAAAEPSVPVSRSRIALIMAAFIVFQATNATAMTIMTVYVTETLHLGVFWAGIALGVAAALEVPALLAAGRLSERYSHLRLIAFGCLAGVAYYVGLAFVTGPVALIGLQVLNAVCFAAISGIGLPLFQEMIPRPGLSTGLYTNTRRLGSIVSGPIIAFGSAGALGQRGIFVTCAALTIVGLVIIGIAHRVSARRADLTSQAGI